MAKIKDAVLNIPPSGSPDVVGYKLYIQQTPAAVTYDSEAFDLGNVASIDLATLPGFTTRDGVYNIGVAAIDDAGNESSMSKLNDVPLDFVAPDPPGVLVLNRL